MPDEKQNFTEAPQPTTEAAQPTSWPALRQLPEPPPEVPRDDLDAIAAWRTAQHLRLALEAKHPSLPPKAPAFGGQKKGPATFR